MLYNAIYTDSPGFPIASVQGICWRTQTAHSAPVPRIWAHGEEWNKPKFPPDTARTQWGIAANTPKPHYPARHMQLMQLQDISLSQHPSKDSYSLNIKDKVKMWLLGLGGRKYSVMKYKQHWNFSRNSYKEVFSLLLLFTLQREFAFQM